MIKHLEVFYKNKKVGTLAITKDNSVAFQYDKTWLKEGFSISPFSLPLDEKVFVNSNHRLFDGLFGVFRDSFVDAWGEVVISRYLKTKGINYTELNVLDKLSLIGSNPMGALTYKPSTEVENIIENGDFDYIQKEINKILNNQDADIDQIFKLGGSSGGTRPKILTKIDNKDVIVKFRSNLDRKDIANQEYLYMSLAKKTGIQIPEIGLIHGVENDYYFIERFDRANNDKIHVISVSALLECDFNAPCLDYLDLIKLTKILTRNKNDVLEMFTRMVFNVVFENLDDHCKNFAFIYDEDIKSYRLSPAFDITPSQTYFGEHTTSINGKGKNISKEDMLEVAKKSNIDINTANKIIDDIVDLIEPLNEKPPLL